MKNSYWLFGTRLSVLADQANTEGRYDLVEGCFSPGTQTPPHRHRAYAEQLYVLDGEFTVWAGGRKAVLCPGDAGQACLSPVYDTTSVADNPM